nr:hypothetical protein CFP56_71442 [Quercus suber]
MSDTKDKANVLQADTRLVDSKSDTPAPSPKELEAQPDDGTSAEPITLSKSFQKALVFFLATITISLAMWILGWSSIKDAPGLEGVLIWIVASTVCVSLVLRERQHQQHSYRYDWILEICLYATAQTLGSWLTPRILQLCSVKEA